MGYEAISLLEALNGLTVVPRRVGQRRRAPAANISPSVPPTGQHVIAASEQPEVT